MQDFLEKTKQISSQIATLSTKIKNKVLYEMADEILKNYDFIIHSNNQDIKENQINNLNANYIKSSLLLTKDKIKAMSEGIKKIALQNDPIGKILKGWVTQDGLKIQRVTVPIGIIGVIYENRPHVTSNMAALCFKSGNISILEGGGETKHSNKAITTVLKNVLLSNKIPEEAISLLPNSNEQIVSQLIKQNKYIDLIIPKGEEKLLDYVSQNSTVPVIKQDKGLCHTYIDKFADGKKALEVTINAKSLTPLVYNSLQTLLIHKEVANYILPTLYEVFTHEKIEIRGCKETKKILDGIKSVTPQDYTTKYLSNILCIKIVKDINEAISHINHHGSKHSEAIISENYSNINKFLDEIDAACVYSNVSTKFTNSQAFEFGLEMGVSTNKLHSRGPMRLNDLTTFKYKILGNGQIRR